MIISDEDRRARACAELRRGAPIVVTESGGAALALSAEMVRDAVWREVRSLAPEPWALAVTARRARTLSARPYDGDVARIRVRPDHTAAALRAIADPAQDLDHPLLGPHETMRDGEADLHRSVLALCKRAKLLPAALIAYFSDQEAGRAAAAAHDLTVVARSDSVVTDGPVWREAVAARVPLSVGVDSRMRVFRRAGWDDEHYAIEIGDPDRSQPVLTRLHSACATGDLFGSLKCDCGPQLHAALERIAAAGAGVLLYLLQEGRGIGLANKMRAYRLQDEGFDTVQANHRLGFQDDERILTEGGEILAAMGFTRARLMTNNPAKVAALEEAGVEVVDRVPLKITPNAENAAYLAVKAAKSGHLL